MVEHLQQNPSAWPLMAVATQAVTNVSFGGKGM
jgi:uncharacterized Ntn-hydrolase superfamily protein